MSWKTKFPNLYKRLLVASNAPSISSLDKKITRAANGLTTEEALFVIAQKYGLRFSRDFGRLSSDSRLRVNNAIRGSQASVVSSANAKTKRFKDARSRIVTINTPFGTLTDPYLPSHIVTEAVNMSETAYPHLYFLENSVRNFISVVLTNKSGPDWWKRVTGTKTLNEIFKKAAGRMKSEERYSYHGKRGAHPIFYIDFPDLVSLMRAFQNDFNAYFGKVPGKLNGFMNKFDELTPSRNITAHNNPLSKRDGNRLAGYLHDWLDQLAYLKANGVL